MVFLQFACCTIAFCKFRIPRTYFIIRRCTNKRNKKHFCTTTITYLIPMDTTCVGNNNFFTVNNTFVVKMYVVFVCFWITFNDDTFKISSTVVRMYCFHRVANIKYHASNFNSGSNARMIYTSKIYKCLVHNISFRIHKRYDVVQLCICIVALFTCTHYGPCHCNNFTASIINVGF